MRSAEAETVAAREAVLTIQGSAAVASSRSKERGTPAAEIAEAGSRPGEEQQHQQADRIRGTSSRISRHGNAVAGSLLPSAEYRSSSCSSLQESPGAVLSSSFGKNAERLEELQARVSESSKDVLRGAEKLQENARAALSSLWATRSSDGTPEAASAPAAGTAPAVPGGEPGAGAMAAVGAGMQQFWRQMSGNDASRPLRKQTPAKTAEKDLAPGATQAAAGSHESEDHEAASGAVGADGGSLRRHGRGEHSVRRRRTKP